MKIIVFGAGAIGGFIAGALSRAGVQTGIVARGPHLRAIQENGLQIQSDLGTFNAKITASNDLRDFSTAEFVLVTFKSHHWQDALPQFNEAIKAGTTIVTLQNGLPFWYERDRTLESVDPGGKIRAAIPYRQIIGGVVHASGSIPRPGVVHQSGGMLYPIGEPDGAMTPRVRSLAQMLECAGLQAPIESDIRRLVWRKLLGNLALNPVSALTRTTVRQMLDDPPARGILRAIIEEGSSVARAGGMTIEFTPDERLEMARHIADVKTSMLQDLEAGKALELEPICGAVIELAKRYGIEVPHVQTVYALTKLLAAVRRQ